MYVGHRTESADRHGVPWASTTVPRTFCNANSREVSTMKNAVIIGIALVVIGAAVLGYDHYSYTTKEQVLQIGPITATAEKTHTVSLPPVLGWLLVGGGLCLVVFGIAKKN